MAQAEMKQDVENSIFKRIILVDVHVKYMILKFSILGPGVSLLRIFNSVGVKK